MSTKEVYVVGHCVYGGKAGFGIYWGPGHWIAGDVRNHSGLVKGLKKTGPCAELEGAIMAVNMAKSHGYRRIQVNMKSTYVTNLFTGRNRHRQNGDLIQELSNAKKEMQVTWKFIGKESRDGGIEQADQLARLAVAGDSNHNLIQTVIPDFL